MNICVGGKQIIKNVKENGNEKKSCLFTTLYICYLYLWEQPPLNEEGNKDIDYAGWFFPFRKIGFINNLKKINI